MNRRLTIVLVTLFAAFMPAVRRRKSAHVLDPRQASPGVAQRRDRRRLRHRSVYAKGADAVTPIASLTKLMTAMVTLDDGLVADETITIDIADLDFVKGSHSRLRMGAEFAASRDAPPRADVSENRARRVWRGPIRAEPGPSSPHDERKAAALGMTHTRYADSTGLSAQNVSTANDLAMLVAAAAEYPQIRDFSTTGSHYVEVQPTGQILGYNNTNNLVKNGQWDIKLSKTGYIREAGKCLVMLATIASKPFVIVLLDSAGKYTRLGDAQRVRHWLETGETLPATAEAKPAAKARKAKPVAYRAPARRTAPRV
jgi:D-alanyl-D-alanine endopeptidase (penicillin-binding protein 7)